MDYYNKIKNVPNAAELAEVVKKWEKLSERIKEKPVNKPILLPDMLWIARTGVGVSNLLEMMTEYLRSKSNLMEFTGDVSCFEFVLDYCAPNNGFGELSRLNKEITDAAGFRNMYKGVVYIDINAWLEHLEEPNFLSFMEYLSDNSDNWFVVLGAYSKDEAVIERLVAIISMYLRIEKVNLPMPTAEDFLAFVEEELDEYNISLDESAKKVLVEAIGKISSNKYFDGYKSIKLLCQDVVYEIFSREEAVSYTLAAEDVANFSADSEYVKNVIFKNEKLGKMGFGF